MDKRIKHVFLYIFLFLGGLTWLMPGMVFAQEKNEPFRIINPKMAAKQPMPKSNDIEKGTAVSANLDIIFVIDNSGSMQKNDPHFITKKVVTNFLDELDARVRLGMVVFDEKAKLIQPLDTKIDATGRTRLLQGLEQVNYRGKYTNSPDGVERAIYELKNNGRPTAEKLIIFLTDGIVDTGNKKQDLENTKWLKEDLANEAQKAGIRIIGIAFTENADFRLIQSLAFKTNGEYYRAFNADDISAVFQNIKKLLSKPQKIAPPQAVAQTVSPIDMPISANSEPTQEAAPLIQPEGYKIPEKKMSPSILYMLVGVIVFLSMIIFFKFFRDRSHRAALSDTGADSYATDINRSGDSEIPPAELIDVENISTKQTSSLLIAKHKVTIGRDTNNDIVIPKNTISSFHATIEYSNGYFFVEDHRSTNGTRLNGKRIKQNTPVILKSGDQIDFANYEFRFLLFDQAPLGETVMFAREDLDKY